MKDIKLKLLEDYYNKNKTINNISQKYVETYNGKEIKLGSFINDMRKTYKKYNLNKDSVSKKNQERIEFLTNLNIDWTPNKSDWDNKYELLKEYYNEHNNIDIPYEYKVNNVKLGVFLSNQRVLHRKYNPTDNNKTLEKHFKLLEELNIIWDVQDTDWNTKYEACKKYYNEFGNLNVGESLIYNDINIGVFVTNQRSLYQKVQNKTVKRKDLTNINNHFKLLEDIGIIWYPNKTKREEIKQELINYKNKHGNLNIKTSYKVKINNEEFPLGIYLSDTRKLTKKKKLTQSQLDRIKLLDELGIDWNPNESLWQEKYELLKEYKEEYNNINISVNYKVIKNNKTYNLGKFLSKQREIYRNNKQSNFKECNETTLNHIKLLEDLGVVWNPQKEDWKETYTYIKYYYDKYKTIEVPMDYIENINGKDIEIGRLIKNQKDSLGKRRKDIEKGSAPLEIMLRYNMLSKLGFKFTNDTNTVVYNDKKYTIPNLCKLLSINITTFKKYYKKYNDVNKSVRVCLLLKKINIKEKEITLKDILSLFNISINELSNSLEKTKLNITNTNNTILYKDNTTLKRYCLDNNYNYKVVEYAYKLKLNNLMNNNLVEIINRVLINYNNKQIPTWIYSNYGNEIILRHFLNTLNLETNMIIKDMKENASTLQESIKNNCFKLQVLEDKNDYLKDLYNLVISKYNQLSSLDKAEEYLNNLVHEYYLVDEEYNTIKLSLLKYISSINRYHIYLLALTNNIKEKKDIISKYHLTKPEIIESFFLNINYINHSLINKNSKEYKRRENIYKLVINWNNLTEEEKDNYFNLYNLDLNRDYEIIENLNKDINELV